MIKIKTKAAYVGEVVIPAVRVNNVNRLETVCNGVRVKILDQQEHNINPFEVLDEKYLLGLPAAKVSGVASVVMFSVIEYLAFLQEKLNIKNVNDKGYVILIVNVKDFDNAFYNGSYFVFGNGKDMFQPLVSPDIVFHELTHSLIHNTCDLVYQGESGALNESIADCFACCLEFYIYEKYNTNESKEDDIDMMPNFFLGEQVIYSNYGKYLRNLVNPLECRQPMKYKGQYWADTQSTVDNGGVHINSGVPNHMFYLLCDNLDRSKAIQLLFRVMMRLSSKATFKEYAVALQNLVHVEDYGALMYSLNVVGLFRL